MVMEGCIQCLFFHLNRMQKKPKTDPPGDDTSWGMENSLGAVLFPPVMCPLSSKSPASFQ